MRKPTSEDGAAMDSGELEELWMLHDGHEVHPEEGCPVVNARFHQWVDECDTFQDGWIDWYETNKQIERSIHGAQE